MDELEVRLARFGSHRSVSLGTILVLPSIFIGALKETHREREREKQSEREMEKSMAADIPQNGTGRDHIVILDEVEISR